MAESSGQYFDSFSSPEHKQNTKFVFKTTKTVKSKMAILVLLTDTCGKCVIKQRLQYQCCAKTLMCNMYLEDYYY